MLSINFSQDDPGGAPVIMPVVEGAVPAAFAGAAAADGFTGAAEAVCEALGGGRQVLLAGVGAGPDDAAFEAAGALAAAKLLRRADIVVDARGLKKRQAVALLTGIVLRAWHFSGLITKPDDGAVKLSAVMVVADQSGLAESWARQDAVLQGTNFARDLVTQPSNLLTPAGFVARLSRLTDAGVTLRVVEGAALAQAGLTGMMAVGGGSAHAPKLAILRWKGSVDTPPVAFVGKGITFDTGGICIKPADAMWDMRADMAGAAACAGAMLALALRKSPAPAMAVLALAENNTDGASYRPSDILRHANGTTIEVVDTDAEGRLVLADALGVAAGEKPQAIIDLATLTGNVVTALGHHMAGIFANDDALAAAVAAAGAASGEPVWRLPIAEGHRRELDSQIADIRHCSPDRFQPDACQAAAFLREFVGDTPWVHIDIAGVENHEEASGRHRKGATGFGVRLLDRLVADRFEDGHRA